MPIAPSPRGFSFSTLSFDGGILAATSGMTITRLDADLRVLSSETTAVQPGGWIDPKLHALTDGLVAHAVSTYWTSPMRSRGALFRLGTEGMPVRANDGGYEATNTFLVETPWLHEVYTQTAVSADGSELLVVYSVDEYEQPAAGVFGLRLRRDGQVVSGPTLLLSLPPDSEMAAIRPLGIAVASDGVVVAALESKGEIAPERLVLQRFSEDWTAVGDPRLLDVPHATRAELIPPPRAAEGNSTADVSVLLPWQPSMELRLWAKVFDGGTPETVWEGPPPSSGLYSLGATARRDESGVEIVWIDIRSPDNESPVVGRVWSQLEGFPPVELTAAGPIPTGANWRSLEVSPLGPRDRVVFTTSSDGGELEMLEGLKYCIP